MTSFFHGLASIVSLLVPLVLDWPLAQQERKFFPSKPITILVGFATERPSDTMARIVGQQLSASLGQPVLVDNRPGAGGKIAMQSALKAPRDGHTIAYISTSMMSISPLVDTHLGYDTTKDIPPAHDRVAWPQCPGSQCRAAGAQPARAGGLCKSQSGQTQLRQHRQWQLAPPGRRKTTRCPGY